LNPRSAQQEKNEEAMAQGGYSPAAAGMNSLEISGQEESGGIDLLLLLWRDRRFIAKAFAAGFLLAAVVSLLIPAEYQSTARFMPPEKQGLSGLAGMFAAAGEDKAGSVVSSLVTDAMGIKTSGALFVGVLKSRTIQDALVDRFELRRAYHVRLQQDARDRLSTNTDINEDRKSGIISITVTDRSPQRALLMAQAYGDILNSLMAELNTSAAHKERVFVEERLKTVKQELDAAAKDLSEFSSKNMTLDVKEQGKAMVAGAAALQGELIAAESQLSGMEQIYTENNVRVRSLKARINELKQQLSSLKGVDPVTGVSEPDASNEFGASITKLPLLSVTYYDLFRRAKIQETVFEILTKQYELAKISEAKELPSIKILDQPILPETKSSPHRTIITLAGAFLAALLASLYVAGSVRLRSMSITNPAFGLFGLEVREGLAADLRLARARWREVVHKVRSSKDQSSTIGPEENDRNPSEGNE
jgi:capsule polysaccharide export protein KpsE/RkpR